MSPIWAIDKGASKDKDEEAGSRVWAWLGRPGVAAVISVIALLVAVGSALINYDLQHQGQLQAQRSRLTTLIETINSNDASADPKNTTVGAVFPALDEAAALIDSLEGTELRSTVFEKVAVASGYNLINEPARSAELAVGAEAEAQGKSLAEKTAAARLLAVDYFDAGEPEKGHDAYNRVFAYIAEATKGYSRSLLDSYIFETHQGWVRSEIKNKDCPRAVEQLRLATIEFNNLAPGAEPPNVPGEFKELTDIVNSKCIPV